MRRIPRTRLLLLLWALIFAAGSLFPVIPAGAAEKKEYTYTVRVFAGSKGTLGGKTVQVFKDVTSFSSRQVTVNVKDPNRYYVMGLRESGRDNNTWNTVDGKVLQDFPVTRDIDLVVAYGIVGNSVSYTVNYKDTAGNQLAPSETYYGNVGDMPVVAYLYVDGYFPQARNLTRTLKEDASQNVFTFVYQKIETETPTTAAQPQSQTQTQPQTQNQGGTNGGTTATQPTAPAANTNNGGTTGGNTPEAGANNAGGENAATPTAPTAAPAPAPTAAAPQAPAGNTGEGQPAAENTPAQPTLPASQDDVPDLVNLDDNSVPLANFPGGTTETTEAATQEETTREEVTEAETHEIKENPAPAAGGFFSSPVKVGVTFGAVILVLLGIILFLLKRR